MVLQQHKETLFVTTPTIFELWSGIAYSSKPEEEKRKVTAVLESQLILDLDKPCAEEAGKIDGMLVKQGATIEPEDCMIAGIAQHHDEPILTRNVKHFSRIKSVRLETY